MKSELAPLQRRKEVCCLYASQKEEKLKISRGRKLNSNSAQNPKKKKKKCFLIKKKKKNNHDTIRSINPVISKYHPLSHLNFSKEDH